MKEPKEYTKKPVKVNAIQWTGNNLQSIVDFDDNSMRISGKQIRIYTLEGIMRANPGDYIVRGIRGEYYPVKQKIFEETYMEVVN